MLRSILVAIALVAGVTVAEATELTGKIASIDAGKGTITLANGMTFVLPRLIAAADLAVGERVKITYRAGKTNAASSIVVAR